jgi:ribosome-interacting GTPase 1
MATIQDQIESIEEEIHNTQKNKATEHHIGKLKAKIAKLKAQQELQRAKSVGGGKGYYVKKSGDATVALVGYPSVGKSSLLNRLTCADAEVGAYQFTTLEVIPGVMEYKGAKIQVLDMPGIIEGASRGKGRGREVIAAARTSDIILLMGDVYNYRLDLLERELYEAGIRLDKRPPDITLKSSDRGGITVRSTVSLTKMTEREVAEILRAYGIVNGVITIREDIDHDTLVDFLAGNRIYVPSLAIINKMDMESGGIRQKISDTIKREYFSISVEKDQGVEELKELVYQKLGFIRVYLKPQGEKADMEEPLVILKKSTVKTVCEHLHRDFVRLFRYAKVWGKSAKFPGQTVGLDCMLADGDVLTIVVKGK